MTPRTLFIYLDHHKTELKKSYEKDYNLQIINAFYNKVFKEKKYISLKNYLIGDNAKKAKIMNKNELLDALKKCHIAFGGNVKDFGNV